MGPQGPNVYAETVKIAGGAMAASLEKSAAGLEFLPDNEERALSDLPNQIMEIVTGIGTPLVTKGQHVYFYNVSGGAYGSDMTLIENNGKWGLIDAGHRYQDTIKDADGTVYSVPAAKELSNQTTGKNGRDGMIYMIETLGVDHLDFVIATHAHADHIGGIPEIAGLLVLDEKGESRHLIDETTVFLYKTYHHVNSDEDDLGSEKGDQSWHNQAFYYQALSAINRCGGSPVDVSCGVMAEDGTVFQVDYTETLEKLRATTVFSDAAYSSKSSTNSFDDRLSLSWNGAVLDIYNLFSVKDAISENVNSLVAIITLGNQKIYVGGDINVENQAEQKIARAIAEDHGHVDAMKLSHHGHDRSNSKELIDLLRPAIAVCPGSRESINEKSPSRSYNSLKYYAQMQFNTEFYEIGASGKLLFIDFQDDGMQVFCVKGEPGVAKVLEADNCLDSNVPSDGWSSWDVSYGKDTQRLWYYFENGLPVTGRKRISNRWYYFGQDGFMADNQWIADSKGWMWANADGDLSENEWHAADGGWYYFKQDGYMACNQWINDGKGWAYLGSDGKLLQNRWFLEGKKWYYLKPNGYMAADEWVRDNGKWYYVSNAGIMQTGWQKIGGNWYYFNSSGAMQTGWLHVGGSWYYLGSSGAMQIGWQTINGRVYFFKTSGAMASREWVPGYWWLGATGEWSYMHKGTWKRDSRGWRFVDSSGWYARNSSVTIDGVIYQFDTRGYWISR